MIEDDPFLKDVLLGKSFSKDELDNWYISRINECDKRIVLLKKKREKLRREGKIVAIIFILYLIGLGITYLVGGCI